MTKIANCRSQILFLVCAALLLSLLGGCSSKDNPAGSGEPALVLSTHSLSLTGAVEISGPQDQSVAISASNGGVLSYSAVIKSTGTRTSDWMRLLNEVGLTPDSMLLRFSIGSAQAGTYIDTIVVSAPGASNSPQLIEVTMTLRSVLAVSESVVKFIALSGLNRPDSHSVQITSNGQEPFDFTADVNRSWLSVSQSQGTAPGALTIYVDPAGLSEGVDTGVVTVSADALFDSPKLIVVLLDVSAWAPQKAPLEQDLAGVYFMNENEGWAVGRVASIAEVTGYITRTVDGGEHWQLVSIAPQQPLGYIEFLSPTTGFIVGGQGLVLKSVDGGMTWNPQSTPAVADKTDLWDGDFLDLNTGWAVGAKGVIIATTDGGTHWNYQESGTSNALSEISFVDAQYGWAVGNVGTIIHTTDGGQHWVPQQSHVLADLNGVLALDRNSVWAVGKSGNILRTTDGGTTWSKVNSPTSAILQTMYFLDPQEGWITGHDGTILYTDNGGDTWTTQRSSSDLWLRDVFFVNDKIGWVVGEQGVILHTISGGN